MTVQIAAIIFIALWAFWGIRDYLDRGEIIIAVFLGWLGACGTSLMLVIAAFVGSAALGYFS